VFVRVNAADHILNVADHILNVADHVLNVADHVLNVADHVLNVADHILNVADHILIVADHVLNVADHVLNVADHVLNVADHVLNVADPILISNCEEGLRILFYRHKISSRNTECRQCFYRRQATHGRSSTFIDGDALGEYYEFRTRVKNGSRLLLFLRTKM